MSPRKFDKYFVVLGAGTNGKFARLTDSEFRAHVVGVLAIAATASVRGCLLVGDLEAEACDVAKIAGVKEKDAQTSLAKLKAVGVLTRDDGLDCWRVHDWDEVNPAPKADNTAAARQQRRRDKVAAEQGAVTPPVTPASRRDDRDDHAPVTVEVTPTEVEVEVEEQLTSPNGDVVERGSTATSVREVFDYWRQATNHPGAQLLPERQRMIRARLATFTVAEIKQGIDGSQTAGAVDAKSSHRYDDLKNICRSGSNLELYIGYASKVPRAVNGMIGGKLTPEFEAKLLGGSS